MAGRSLPLAEHRALHSLPGRVEAEDVKKCTLGGTWPVRGHGLEAGRLLLLAAPSAGPVPGRGSSLITGSASLAVDVAPPAQGQA